MIATRVVPPDAEGIRLAAEALRSGAPVVMPTETVYGLAADATRDEAVQAVFAAKDRPAHDPLIVHVAPALVGRDALSGLVRAGIVASISGPQLEVASALARQGWPGPLTLVLPRGAAIPDAVSSGLPTVAVRMPQHPVALALITAAGLPLVAPSANRFGRISPTTAAAALAELDGRVGLILDGGPSSVGVESTVLRVEGDGDVCLLRPGAITVEDVAAWTGRHPRAVGAHEGTGGSPGRLLRHYAPKTPLVLVDGGPGTWSAARWADLRDRLPRRRLGYLAVSDPDAASHAARRLDATVIVQVLSPDRAATTAARALYGHLRALDAEGVDLIVTELPPAGEGLAAALRDRLTRAAHDTPPLAS